MLEWLFGKKKQEPQPDQQPKKKKKTQSQQQSEDKWQYEFLVQFLNSPLWRVSILDFVDQNCVIFDNEQQNKFEYTKVHNQFKELVGTLFDGMMQQVGLDDEKLVQLLEKGFESKQKKLFNQLLLCDDFLKFKQLMVKRNKALQNQALKAINGQQRRPSAIDKQRNIIHSSIKQQQQRKKKIQQQQQQILRKVLQMSRIQAEQKKQIERLAQKAQNLEDKKVQQQKLKAEVEQRQRMDKMQKLAKQQAAKQQAAKQQAAKQQAARQQAERLARQNEQKSKSKITKNKNLAPIQTQKTSGLSQLPPLKGVSQKKQITANIQKTQQITKQKQAQQKNTEQFKQQVKAESSEDRKKRLLEQRQKIRKKKEQERKKMLQDEEANNKKTMNIVLQDEGIHDSMHPHAQHENQQKVAKDEIQRRKQIMRKIKNRIVDDF